MNGVYFHKEPSLSRTAQLGDFFVVGEALRIVYRRNARRDENLMEVEELSSQKINFDMVMEI